MSRYGEGRTRFDRAAATARALKIDQAQHCTCWGGAGQPQTPCTPSTCQRDRCKGCRAAGKPWYSPGEVRWLETGQGLPADVVAELERLWRTSSIGSRTAPPADRDRGVCGRGHPLARNGKCRPCAAMNARARRRARRRENGA
jgi:hypothetical protein